MLNKQKWKPPAGFAGPTTSGTTSVLPIETSGVSIATTCSCSQLFCALGVTMPPSSRPCMLIDPFTTCNGNNFHVTSLVLALHANAAFVATCNS